MIGFNRVQRERFENIESRLAAIESGATDATTKRYTVKEVTTILGISRPTLDEWVLKQGLQKVKIGGRIYYSKEEIDTLAKTI